MNCVETPQSQCLVGVSRCDITPTVGIYHRMWGAATHDQSTGVHRPLTVTALVLESLSKETKATEVMIAVDHCLLWTAEMNRLLDFVSTHTGVNRDALVVFFSHTHGAGLMGLERGDLPGGELIEPYLDDLAKKIAGAVAEARNDLQPATIVYGNGRCSLATHRNYFDATSGRFVCGFNPTGTADDTVIVGRVTNDKNVTLATIVNYACHPTTLAWDNTLISPDFVGAMREIVETTTGAPCVFIQGASGDIGPREGFVGDVKVADRNGRQLGYAAMSVLESLGPAGQEFHYTGPVVSGATIGTWKYRPESASRSMQHTRWISGRKVIALKYRSDLPVRSELATEKSRWETEEQQAVDQHDDARARKAHAMVERAMRLRSRVEYLPEGDSYPFTIDTLRIGDAVWIALNGEHSNILQRTLRERFPGVPLIIGTIANGSNVWYLLESDSFGLGLYQEEVSVLAKGSLETVIEAATNEIRQLLDVAPN